MRAVRFHEHGGPDVLQIDEIDAPEPGAGEVRVDVRAAGVNPVDTYFREGSYGCPLPMIPGSDVAGVVDAVGEGVESLAPGDRVFGTGLGKDRPGGYAEYTTAPVDLLSRLPDGVSFAEGAAVALVGVTAWRALIDHAVLRPAETCLVHGGSGGVGHVAVQIAAGTGAHVVTTASDAHLDGVSNLGADVALDYAADDLAAAVTEAGAPDVILDHRCDEYIQFDAEVAAQGARIVGIGQESPEVCFSNFSAARGKELRVHLMSMFNTPDMAAVLRRLARLMADGALRPAVARTYDLDAAADAQRDVVTESVLGKLVIEP